MAVPAATNAGKNSNRPAGHSTHRWTVLGACFAINFLSSALFRNAALFYPSIMDTFLVSREKAALPLFVYGGCFHLGGTGQGIIFNCSVIGLGDQFDSWRGLALGVVMTGAPAASFIFPSLFHYTLGEYGLRGTLLLTGAFMINIPLVGILLCQREPPKHGQTCSQEAAWSASKPTLHALSKPRKKEEENFTSSSSTSKMVTVEAHEKNIHGRSPISSKRTLSSCPLDATLTENSLILKSMPRSASIARVPPNMCQIAENATASIIHTRAKTLCTMAPGELQELLKLSIPVLLESKDIKNVLGEFKKEPHSISVSQRCSSRWSALAKSARAVISTPRFYVIAYGFWAYCFFLDTYLTVIVDYSKDSGVTEADAVHVLSFFSVTDALCRLLIPCLTDWKLISTSLLLALSCLLASLLAAGLPFLTEKVGFWTVALTLGLPCGYINVGIAESLSSVAGEENLPMALGFMSAAAAVGSFTTPCLIGAFRDTWGSYNDLFFVMASALIVGFALFAGLLAWDIFKRKTFVVSRQ
ncbi:uncharacterized protein LOC144119412 isoform X2 [Amblyomma americanum]